MWRDASDSGAGIVDLLGIPPLVDRDDLSGIIERDHLDLHDVALVVFGDAVPARGVQERAGESSIVKNGFELVARYQPVPVRVAPTL